MKLWNGTSASSNLNNNQENDVNPSSENQDDSKRNQRIGDIFKGFAPFLKMYAVYIQTFDQTLDTINRNYDSNPKFKAIMDEIHVSLKYDFVILALYVPSHYIPVNNGGMINFAIYQIFL